MGAGVLDGDDADNPFADWNKVFVPYCSGDNFTGAAVDGTGFGGRTQVGYLNVRLFLENWDLVHSMLLVQENTAQVRALDAASFWYGKGTERT